MRKKFTDYEKKRRHAASQTAYRIRNYFKEDSSIKDVIIDKDYLDKIDLSKENLTEQILQYTKVITRTKKMTSAYKFKMEDKEWEGKFAHEFVKRSKREIASVENLKKENPSEYAKLKAHDSTLLHVHRLGAVYKTPADEEKYLSKITTVKNKRKVSEARFISNLEQSLVSGGLSYISEELLNIIIKEAKKHDSTEFTSALGRTSLDEVFDSDQDLISSSILKLVKFLKIDENKKVKNEHGKYEEIRDILDRYINNWY